jgi:hypothetical protein
VPSAPAPPTVPAVPSVPSATTPVPALVAVPPVPAVPPDRDRDPERSTRYTLLVHLPDGHHAEAVRDGLSAIISRLPTHLRGSLTWDQGCKMARHKQFAMATDMAVYFCDPASPWQRGTNENTNGLLRQYFPKVTDLGAHGSEDLEHVAQQLNGRPRRRSTGKPQPGVCVSYY